MSTDRNGQERITTKRRAWDSNPQALSGNGFQVISQASWLFLPGPDFAYRCRSSTIQLPD
jgi:hypothetical protein